MAAGTSATIPPAIKDFKQQDLITRLLREEDPAVLRGVEWREGLSYPHGDGGACDVLHLGLCELSLAKRLAAPAAAWPVVLDARTDGRTDGAQRCRGQQMAAKSMAPGASSTTSAGSSS